MSHLYPDQINPGSDYERAVTIENAIRLLIANVTPNMWQWALARVINSYGLRLVQDIGFGQYESQMREVTALIDLARNKLTIVPSYHVAPITPSNFTIVGNP
jgi:hypothetical protein